MAKATEAEKQRMREDHQRRKNDPDYKERRIKHRRGFTEWRANYALNNRRTPEGWARATVANIRNRCKKSGLEFNIIYTDIIFPERCPVLDIPLIVGTKEKTLLQSPNSPSVDRFDNSKGYTKENVRVISNRANLLKRDATLDEMRKIVKYMEGET